MRPSAAGLPLLIKLHVCPLLRHLRGCSRSRNREGCVLWMDGERAQVAINWRSGFQVVCTASLSGGRSRANRGATRSPLRVYIAFCPSKPEPAGGGGNGWSFAHAEAKEKTGDAGQKGRRRSNGQAGESPEVTRRSRSMMI